MEQSRLDELRRKFIQETEKGIEALLREDTKRSNKPVDLNRSIAGFACMAALVMACLSVTVPALVIMVVS